MLFVTRSVNKELDGLLKSDDEQLKKLQDIVKQSIAEEKLIISNLIHPPKDILSLQQSITDKVAAFGGSWKFIISFSILLFLWMLVNTIFPVTKVFDPYPFILMNLILSAIAALQAPVIMMSQNRKEEKDRKRNENDYLINLKAEIEIRSLHQKMNLLIETEIKKLQDNQAKQTEILKGIEQNLNISFNTRTKKTDY